MVEHAEGRGRILAIVSSLEFWLIIAYVVLALVLVWLVVIQAQRHRDEAVHRGETIADARAKVNACLLTRPQLRKTDLFLQAETDFHEAVYANAEALLATTPPDTALYRARRANVHRIARTAGPLAAITFAVPTIRECLARGVTRYGTIPPTVPLSGQ